MNPIERKYQRKQFQIWKRKVSKRLPSLIIRFYEMKLKGVKVDERDERMLGRVIQDINSYEYSIGSDQTNEIACICLLEIDVENLFELVNAKMQKCLMDL